MDTVTVSLQEGEVLLDRLIEEGLPIAHDCDGTLACASCRVRVREGGDALSEASEDELDMLDRAGAAEPGARLSCQVIGAAELVVEVPRHDAPVHDKLSPVKVTPRAARHLTHQLSKQPGAVGVRLAVEPSGCSGYGYRLEDAQSLNDGDEVFESEGVRVVVDRLSLPFVQGTTIDLVQEGLARRLRFDNPNVRQSCGCGESFGV